MVEVWERRKAGELTRSIARRLGSPGRADHIACDARAGFRGVSYSYRRVDLTGPVGWMSRCLAKCSRPPCGGRYRMRQGGLGTLGQIHSPSCSLPGVPPPRYQPHRGGPARQSSLYATPMERTSMIGAPKARSPWLPRRSRPHEFGTIQKIRRESAEPGPAAAEPSPPISAHMRYLAPGTAPSSGSSREPISMSNS